MKKLNLKQKISDFIKTFKAEEEILRETERKTPLHNKVNKIVTIILCIIMFFALLGSFPSSAADEPIEPEQKYLSGQWLLNESIVFDGSIPSNISSRFNNGFISNNISYNLMYFERVINYEGLPVDVLTYHDNSINDGIHAYVYYPADNESNWYADECRLVDFGSTPQPVDDVFWTQFTSNATPIPNNPISYTIEEGVYIFDTDHDIFDMEGLTFTYPINFYDLAYRTFDTLTIHSGYYENAHSYVDIYYGSSGYDTLVYKWETLKEPDLFQGARMIYVTEDTEIAIQGAEAFETYFDYLPLMDSLDFDHCALTYQFGFDQGFTDGKEVTYNTAYNEGYYQGYAEGYDSHGNAGVFGNFFDLVYEALDNIPIYESPDGVVSIIDVIQTVLGGFILLFILKLIAGG